MILAVLILVAGIVPGVAVMVSPIQPEPYSPGAPPALEGPTAPNELLREVRSISLGEDAGGEDVAVDAQGRLYTGTASGRIQRIELLNPRKMRVETFANTGGRPLGLHFDPLGNLLVADSYKGLLSVSPTGEITTLSTGAGDMAFKFTDDVDVSPDGYVYFSDASSKFSQPQYVQDFMEARPHGRLLRLEPASGITDVIQDDLYFANGVAVAADGSYVLVVETPRYRVRRVWVKGTKAGTTDTFIEHLPGFPDGISRGEDGLFWLAVHSPRQTMVDVLLHPRPVLKRLLAWAPAPGGDPGAAARRHAVSRHPGRPRHRRLRPAVRTREARLRRVVLTLCVALVLAATRYVQQRFPPPAPQGPGPSPGHTFQARALRVIDGDTIVLTDQRRVRYIGIDAPEKAREGKPSECLADTATQINRTLVQGRTLTLTVGTETHDRYGRLLAYVAIDDGGTSLMVNEELVRRGLAEPLTIAPNDRYADRFEAAWREARQNKAGLWGDGACH